MSDLPASPTQAWSHLTQDVIFDGLWGRPGLCLRDRSLATIVALVATSRTESIAFHVRRALDNGLEADEIIEAVVHTAHYAGWPAGGPAMRAVESALGARA